MMFQSQMFGKKFLTVFLSCVLVVFFFSPFQGSFMKPEKVLAGNQTVYYVSMQTGSDNNPGTLSSPFKTIRKARDVVREINSNMTGDIVVYIRGGIYHVDDGANQ